MARLGEAAEVVDMAERLVVGEAARQPDHTFDPEQGAEVGLDVRLREMRVAVGIEQALRGGQQRSLAVDVDRAAFEDLRPDDASRTRLFEDEARQPGVAGEALEDEAPGVEAPIHPGEPARTVDQERRPGVARPAIVEVAHHDVGDACRQPPRLVGVLGPHHEAHRLMGRDGRYDARQGLAGGAEPVLPRLGPARPRHPAALVGLPFGRHAPSRRSVLVHGFDLAPSSCHRIGSARSGRNCA